MSKLIIFDLDGVLIEAKEIHYNALNSALEEINPELVISWEEHLRSYDGLKTYDKLKLLSLKKQILTEEIEDKIFISKQNHTIKALKNLNKNQRFISLFQQLKENGYLIACCSNSVWKIGRAHV